MCAGEKGPGILSLALQMAHVLGSHWNNMAQFKTRWRATARPYINYGISFPMYDLHERYINLPLLENRSEYLSRETLIHGHPVMANTLQYQFQALHIKRWHNK